MADGKSFRKDRLVSIIYNDTSYVSTDLRSRFKPKGVLSITPRTPILNELWINKTIAKGDYAIFKEKKTFYGGLIFNFMNEDRSSIKNATFYQDKIEINKTKTTNIIMEPLYELSVGKIINHEMSDKYFLMSEYVCHVKDLSTLNLPKLINLINKLISKKSS
jgi:hypothetical protein